MEDRIFWMDTPGGTSWHLPSPNGFSTSFFRFFFFLHLVLGWCDWKRSACTTWKIRHVGWLIDWLKKQHRWFSHWKIGVLWTNRELSIAEQNLAWVKLLIFQNGHQYPLFLDSHDMVWITMITHVQYCIVGYIYTHIIICIYIYVYIYIYIRIYIIHVYPMVFHRYSVAWLLPKNPMNIYPLCSWGGEAKEPLNLALEERAWQRIIEWLEEAVKHRTLTRMYYWVNPRVFCHYGT